MTQERWEQIVRGIFLKEKMVSVRLDGHSNSVHIVMQSEEFPGYTLYYHAGQYGDIKRGQPFAKGLDLNDPDTFLKGPGHEFHPYFRDELPSCGASDLKGVV